MEDPNAGAAADAPATVERATQTATRNLALEPDELEHVDHFAGHALQGRLHGLDDALNKFDDAVAGEIRYAADSNYQMYDVNRQKMQRDKLVARFHDILDTYEFTEMDKVLEAYQSRIIAQLHKEKDFASTKAEKLRSLFKTTKFLEKHNRMMAGLAKHKENYENAVNIALEVYDMELWQEDEPGEDNIDSLSQYGYVGGEARSDDHDEYMDAEAAASDYMDARQTDASMPHDETAAQPGSPFTQPYGETGDDFIMAGSDSIMAGSDEAQPPGASPQQVDDQVSPLSRLKISRRREKSPLLDQSEKPPNKRRVSSTSGEFLGKPAAESIDEVPEHIRPANYKNDDENTVAYAWMEHAHLFFVFEGGMPAEYEVKQGKNPKPLETTWEYTKHLLMGNFPRRMNNNMKLLQNPYEYFDEYADGETCLKSLMRKAKLNTKDIPDEDDASKTRSCEACGNHHLCLRFVPFDDDHRAETGQFWKVHARELEDIKGGANVDSAGDDNGSEDDDDGGPALRVSNRQAKKVANVGSVKRKKRPPHR